MTKSNQYPNLTQTDVNNYAKKVEHIITTQLANDRLWPLDGDYFVKPFRYLHPDKDEQPIEQAVAIINQYCDEAGFRYWFVQTAPMCGIVFAARPHVQLGERNLGDYTTDQAINGNLNWDVANPSSSAFAWKAFENAKLKKIDRDKIVAYALKYVKSGWKPYF